MPCTGGLADYLGDLPIYEALLRRDVRRRQTTPKLTDALLVDFTVAPSAPYEGREVRDLGLPRGALLVSVRRGMHDHVPTADFRLQARDRITAVISPDASQSIRPLRDGTTAEAVQSANDVRPT